MHLYLLRHAIAAERSPRWTGHDAERPLTKKGSKKMERIAAFIKEQDLSFDLILASPFRRARQTAEIVADTLSCRDRLLFSHNLKIGGSRRALISEITTKHRSKRAILLVGHEPYLGALISRLISGEDRTPIALRKGGLCSLRVASLRYGRCATLDWLLAPANMVRRKGKA